MNPIISITRNQLKGYGSTYYQARIITEKIKPIAKDNNSNVYPLHKVIISLKNYLNKTKIKPKTRQDLNSLLPILLELLNNVVPVVFESSTNLELTKLTKNLFVTMNNIDRKMAESKALVANIKGKRK